MNGRNGRRRQIPCDGLNQFARNFLHRPIPAGLCRITGQVPTTSKSGDYISNEKFMTDEAPIRLECQSCGRSMDYDRSIDAVIPQSVLRIVQPSCDRCWNGDFEGETWFDANNNEVSQWT